MPCRARHPSLSALLAATVVAAVAEGCARGEEEAEGPPPLPVEVVRVTRRDVPIELEWTATLDGHVTADVRPQVEGYVTARLYREGTFVEAGTPLFQIDDRTYRQAVEQAQAALGEAMAQLERARSDVARYEPLLPSGAVAGEEVEHARSEAEAAAAAVEAQRARVREARLRLEWTKVVAPIAGVVGLEQVHVGDLVGPDVVLTRISALDPMRASFAITEEQYLASADVLRRLSIEGGDVSLASAEGAPGAAEGFRGSLTLVLADGSTYPHEGRLDAVGLGVEPSTGTLPLEALFPNPDFLLRPGQFARIRLRTGEGRNALVVPERALVEVQEIVQLAVVDPRTSTAELRTARIGPRVEGFAVVEEGVREGELVVVEGLGGLRPGQRVKARMAEPEGAAGGGGENGGAPGNGGAAGGGG